MTGLNLRDVEVDMKILAPEVELDRLFAEGQGLRFAKLKSLHDAYPDLEVFVDGSGRSHSCSEELNEGTDTLEFRMLDRGEAAPLLAWTYVYVPVEGRVYSNPPCHLVAYHAVGGFGEVPVPGWDENMRHAGIPESLIERVSDYLAQHVPVYYQESQ